MNRQQRRKLDRTTAQKYLQLLSALGGAPVRAEVKIIYFFYKADNLTHGFEGNTGFIDEQYAEQIYKLFTAINFDFSGRDCVERKLKIIEYQYCLDNWQAFLQADPSNKLKLISYVWLLEKLNVIPNDNFNGVVFKSVGL